MRGATPNSSVDLCATCTHAFIREGYDGSRATICHAVDPNLIIRGNTVKCSDYRHKNEPEAYDLEKIAWIITTDPKGTIGFRPWVKMSEDERRDIGVRRG